MDPVLLEEINGHIDSKIAEVTSGTNEIKAITQEIKTTADQVSDTAVGLVSLQKGTTTRTGSTSMPITNGNSRTIYLEPFWVARDGSATQRTAIRCATSCGDYTFSGCSCSFNITDEKGNLIGSASCSLGSYADIFIPTEVRIPRLIITAKLSASANYGSYTLSISTRIVNGFAYGI